MLTLVALTRPSCLKGLQLKFLKTLLASDVNCCWNAAVSSWWGSTAWNLEGLLIPSSNSLNKYTSSGPEGSYSSRPVELGLLNRWVTPPSPYIFSLFCSWSWSGEMLEKLWIAFLKEKLPVLNSSYKLCAVNSRFDKSNRWTLHHLAYLNNPWQRITSWNELMLIHRVQNLIYEDIKHKTGSQVANWESFSNSCTWH